MRRDPAQSEDNRENVFTEKQAQLQRCLDVLGNPERGRRVMHIAGTNGKGSIGACLTEALSLRNPGRSVGHFSSPHVRDYRERIRVAENGQSARMIRQEELNQADRMLHAAGMRAEQMSYFSWSLLEALVFFAQKGCADLVIEAGIGGLLDVTNVLSPALSVISSISRDHEGVLGSTLSEIARHKAGIIKQGVPAVSANQCAEVEQVLRARAAAQHAPLALLRPEEAGDAVHILYEEPARMSFSYRAHRFSTQLIGLHQLQNMGTALLAMEQLSIPLSIQKQALDRVQWLGRFQRIHRAPDIWIDGAHNDDAVAQVLANWRWLGIEKPILIFGQHPGKIRELPLRRLFAASEEVYEITAIDEEAECDAQMRRQLERAIKKSRSLNGRTIFICGSLYILGAALRCVAPVVR
ncbi:MAG: Mur ligase family protein [Ndongobacter sp.]|nr:Mur ligase family protein [Ndongobacter sp.]